jgi:hypothetical protein
MDCYLPHVAIGAFSLLAVFFILFIIFVCVVMGIIKAVAYCRIFSKAGYGWAWGLLMLLPLVHTIMLFVLGFSKWPIQQETDLLKKR